MADFVFMFRGGDPISSAEARANWPKWTAWFKRLADEGHVKSLGNPLEPAGKLVRGKGKAVTDGPFAEAKDVVNGFITVTARNLEEAAEIAKGCPSLERDGAVEVRPVMQPVLPM